jgi:hypothetical protein
MPDLEDRLRALAADLEWPPTPDLATAVAGRVASGVADRGGRRERRRFVRRRRLAVALVLALLVPAAGAIAFPSARDDVLEWLGVKGATVTRAKDLPAAEALRVEDLGRRVSLAEAEQAVGFPPAVPQALAAPREVRFDAATDTVTLVYDGLLVSQTPGALRRELVDKVVTTRSRVRPTTVEGRPGVFIEGAPHYVLFARPNGTIAEDRGRLAGDTLVYNRGGTLVRIEARDLSLARAREIARSIR